MNPEPIGIGMILKHFNEKYLSGGVEAAVSAGRESKSAVTEEGVPLGQACREDSAPPAQTSLNQEVVLELTRYSDTGMPVTLSVLCCAKNSREQQEWKAYPEGEVTEDNANFKAGEILCLTPEEMIRVEVEAEAEYLRD